MLWAIVAVLLVLWIMGWSMEVAGIHLLLLLTAVIIVLWKLATTGRTA